MSEKPGSYTIGNVIRVYFKRAAVAVDPLPSYRSKEQSRAAEDAIVTPFPAARSESAGEEIKPDES